MEIDIVKVVWILLVMLVMSVMFAHAFSFIHAC